MQCFSFSFISFFFLFRPFCLDMLRDSHCIDLLVSDWSENTILLSKILNVVDKCLRFSINVCLVKRYISRLFEFLLIGHRFCGIGIFECVWERKRERDKRGNEYITIIRDIYVWLWYLMWIMRGVEVMQQQFKGTAIDVISANALIMQHDRKNRFGKSRVEFGESKAIWRIVHKICFILTILLSVDNKIGNS